MPVPAEATPQPGRALSPASVRSEPAWSTGLIVIFNCCFVDIVYVFVSFDDDVIGVCERASSKHHFPGISLIAPPPVTPGKRLSQTTLCSG